MRGEGKTESLVAAKCHWVIASLCRSRARLSCWRFSLHATIRGCCSDAGGSNGGSGDTHVKTHTHLYTGINTDVCLSILYVCRRRPLIDLTADSFHCNTHVAKGLHLVRAAQGEASRAGAWGERGGETGGGRRGREETIVVVERGGEEGDEGRNSQAMGR